MNLPRKVAAARIRLATVDDHIIASEQDYEGTKDAACKIVLFRTMCMSRLVIVSAVGNFKAAKTPILPWGNKEN